MVLDVCGLVWKRPPGRGFGINRDEPEPPLPPHITIKDARTFASMMRTELRSVIGNSVEEPVAGVLPGGN